MQIDNLNDGLAKALNVQEKVVPLIQKAYAQLIDLARSRHIFTKSSAQITDNNLQARSAANVDGPGDSLAEFSRTYADTCPDVATEKMEINRDNPSPLDAFCHMLENTENQALEMRLMGSSYLIPAHARFLMSNISHLSPLVSDSTKYDLLILDPPWFNKSIKRKKKYDCVPNEDLLSIPLKELCSTSALVAVWVTNRVKHQSFVKEELFRKHNISFVAEWYWLKVTTQAETVCKLDLSLQKKPYETLIIGRFGDALESKLPELPDHQVLMSVPSSFHSRKPPLDEVLKPFIVSNPMCLELFARSLLPGWTSWGNEVIRFQHTDYFKKYDCNEPVSDVS